MRAIIFANGVMLQPPARFRPAPGEDLIIAADGGLRHCLRLSLTPHAVIGDLDSVDPAQIEDLENRGVEIIRHPVHKDQTDLELALKLAVAREAAQIVIIGALGARWDMTLANTLLLARPFLSRVTVSIMDEQQESICLRGPGSLSLKGQPGDTLSLIPLAASAHGVTLQGLEYPLLNATLPLGSTHGLSNVFKGANARIELKQGALLVIQTPLS